MKHFVSLTKAGKSCYPNSIFPSKKYPEYPFSNISQEPNFIYECVRESFKSLKLDLENFDTPYWNPLKKYVSPGSFVVIKPNLVMDSNPSGDGLDCMITHPSVVAAVLDYVYIALQGRGTIVVGDAPVQGCDFDSLVETSGYKALIDFYKNTLPSTISIELKDFRGLVSNALNGVNRYQETGEQGITVNLGSYSAFAKDSNSYLSNLRITNYDPSILKTHHCNGKHEYLVDKDVLQADVIINVPKPKTHRKAGMTISLKNMVGVNVRKEYLPHHSNGSISEGGDCYRERSVFKKLQNKCLDKSNYYAQGKKRIFFARIFRNLAKICRLMQKISGDKDGFFEGSWYGNDTISKTISDLNKIVFYADKNGIMKDKPQRKMFIVADMIVSGEGEGPLMPTSKNVGLIAAGDNPVAFDCVISYLAGMKLDMFNTIKQIKKNNVNFPLIDQNNFNVKTTSNYEPWNKDDFRLISDEDLLYFRPSRGWIPAFKTTNVANNKK